MTELLRRDRALATNEKAAELKLRHLPLVLLYVGGVITLIFALLLLQIGILIVAAFAVSGLLIVAVGQAFFITRAKNRLQREPSNKA